MHAECEMVIGATQKLIVGKACCLLRYCMSNLQLSIAIGDYDHTRDLTSGRVRAEGIELVSSLLPPEEVFHRFGDFREWDVSEMSMGRYAALRSQGDCSITALPVFVSRMFRHSMIYVREGSAVRVPADLRGKRVGVPEWAQTACIYTRGMLAHDAGVPLESVHWVQAGINDTGREEKVRLDLPPTLMLDRIRDRSLNDMLVSGEIDAMLSARAPAGLGRGIVRMFPDHAPVEKAYFLKTGIFPIMHVVTLRSEVLERHPWVAMNLIKAFEEAKSRSYARLLDITASPAPLAWLNPVAHQMVEVFGNDFWPYGLEKNRVTLDAFLGFAHEQSIASRLMLPEELFPRQTLSRVKI
jgi:4,5-dihydroxyphthalate decarboxylase